MRKKPYPSDIGDEEWNFACPYLTLMKPSAPQRVYPMRELFDALRWLARSGAPWRMLPGDFPPWEAVYQQMHRWLKAKAFEGMVNDLQVLLRWKEGRGARPTAVVMDSRTLQSTVESGSRAGYDGAKRKKGSKVHIVVDTLGHLLALHVTPADEQDRAQVGLLAKKVQEVTGENVELAYVDQGYTGESAQEAARREGIELYVVKTPEAKKGFVLLPKRWVVERSFGWASRFRRLVKDYERLPQTLAGLHFLVFTILLLPRFIDSMKNCA